MRCIDCNWCRADPRYEPGETYKCLKLDLPIADEELWGPACRDAKPRLTPYPGAP
jgi:hypothetical protein